MKKMALLFTAMFVLGFIMSGVALAKDADVIPSTVIIKVNDDGKYAKYQGLLVRVNTKDDKFFSHSYFISADDVKKLAEKRKVKCNIDLKAKKVTMGKESFDLVAIDVNEKNYLYRKIRFMKNKGKYYFDTWGFYPGLGFSSVSRMSDGVYFYDPKLDKKKKK